MTSAEKHAEAERLRQQIKHMTELRDAAVANGDMQPASDMTDAIYAVMEELQQLVS